MCDWKALSAEVIGSLTREEKEESIVYIEQRVISVGETIPWLEDASSLDVPSVMAFVDLEPELNWTHRGRYVILNARGGIRRIVDAQLPPFLREVSPDLRLIHMGNRAPDWAAVTSTPLA